jgi:hypothetical protein
MEAGVVGDERPGDRRDRGRSHRRCGRSEAPADASNGLAAGGHDLLGDCLGERDVGRVPSDVDDDHPSPAFGEEDGVGPPKAAPGAGHDGAGTVEAQFLHQSPPVSDRSGR